MLTVLESLLPVFAVIFLGLFIRRQGYVPEPQWEGMQRLSYRIFFPALLCTTLIKADLTAIPVAGVAATSVLASLSMSAIVITLFPVFRQTLGLTNTSNTSMYLGTVRWNGFIALAIVAKLHGDEGIAIVAVTLAVLAPLINVTTILVMAVYAGSGGTSARSVMREIITNPFIISSLIGLVINLGGVPIPDPVITTLDILAGPALAIGLLMVGAGLRLRYALPPTAPVWVAAALRLIGMPLLMLTFGLLMGLDATALQVALIGGAVPTAMIGYVVARELGGDAPLYAAIATIQTFISALVIPLVIWLLPYL